MIERYPIPPDGEILTSKHLHDQTLFTLAQVGRGLRGSWGFFRPPDSTGLANRVFIQDGYVVIENLAAISPEGFSFQAEKLSAFIPAVGRSLRLSWTLPSDASENDGLVGISLAVVAPDIPEEPGSVVIGEIGGRRRSNVSLTAPAFTIDSVALLVDSWSKLGKALHDITSALDGSSRGNPFERLLVGSAFNQLDSALSDTPIQATRKLNTALEQLAGFVHVNAGRKIDQETEILLTHAGKCCAAAKEGPTALYRALSRLTSTLAKTPNAVRDWLSAGKRELRPDNEIVEAGMHMVKDYSLGNTAPGPVHVTLVDVEAGPEPMTAWVRFDDAGWQELIGRRTDHGIEASLEPPAGAARLSLRCTVGMDTVVIQGVAESDRSPPVQPSLRPPDVNGDALRSLSGIVNKQDKALLALQAEVKELRGLSRAQVDQITYPTVRSMPDTGAAEQFSPSSQPFWRLLFVWIPACVSLLLAVFIVFHGLGANRNAREATDAARMQAQDAADSAGKAVVAADSAIAAQTAAEDAQAQAQTQSQAAAGSADMASEAADSATAAQASAEDAREQAETQAQAAADSADMASEAAASATAAQAAAEAAQEQAETQAQAAADSADMASEAADSTTAAQFAAEAADNASAAQTSAMLCPSHKREVMQWKDGVPTNVCVNHDCGSSRWVKAYRPPYGPLQECDSNGCPAGRPQVEVCLLSS